MPEDKAKMYAIRPVDEYDGTSWKQVGVQIMPIPDPLPVDDKLAGLKPGDSFIIGYPDPQ